jgi:hypothetical protein
MTRWEWQRCLLALIACLVVAGCAAPGNQPVQNYRDGPVHGESGGGGGGSGGM